MGKVTVVGGPADGAKVPLRGAFEHIDHNGVRRRSDLSGLYRVVEGRYEHAEAEYYVCEGCGSFHKRGPERCTLCGADAAPGRRSPSPD